MLHILCLWQADSGMSQRQLPVVLQRVSHQALKEIVCDQVVEGEGGGSHRMPKHGALTTGQYLSICQVLHEPVQCRYVNQPEPELQGHSVTVKADQARIDSMCRDAEQTWPPALSKLMQVGIFLHQERVGFRSVPFTGTSSPCKASASSNTVACQSEHMQVQSHLVAQINFTSKDASVPALCSMQGEFLVSLHACAALGSGNCCFFHVASPARLTHTNVCMKWHNLLCGIGGSMTTLPSSCGYCMFPEANPRHMSLTPTQQCSSQICCPNMLDQRAFRHLVMTRCWGGDASFCTLTKFVGVTEHRCAVR